MTSLEETVTLCLSCADLIDAEADNEPVCPHCGIQVDREQYKRLMSYGAHLARFGYQYRKQYEETTRSGERNVRFFLVPLGEIFAWLALAVASGVVGNAASDSIKAAIGKIRRRVGHAGAVSREDVALLSDEELVRFALYVAQFAANPRSLPREVLDPVLEEVAVDFSEELRELKEPDYLNKFAAAITSRDTAAAAKLGEVLNAFVWEARGRVDERLQPPDDIDWEELWRNAGA